MNGITLFLVAISFQKLSTSLPFTKLENIWVGCVMDSYHCNVLIPFNTWYLQCFLIARIQCSELNTEWSTKDVSVSTNLPVSWIMLRYCLASSIYWFTLYMLFAILPHFFAYHYNCYHSHSLLFQHKFPIPLSLSRLFQ